MQHVNDKRQKNMQSFDDLYEWSIGAHREDFWADCWHYLPLIHEGSYEYVIEPGVRMDKLPRFFKGVRLNFAENALYTPAPYDKSQRTTRGKEDDKIMCDEVREGISSTRSVTWGEVRARTAAFASAMRATGAKKGDRAAVVASNSVDTLCVFMAVTSIGGLFSSSSTDMGTKGILDRTLQIKPKWIFMDDAALYNGKKFDLRQKMAEVVEGMKNVAEFQGIVSMPRWEQPLDITSVPRTQTLNNFLSKATSTSLHFERVEFRDPFLIAYSSGTSGPPKCIVHSTGGVLLSTKKEGILHRDTDPSAAQLQYTTTGWIMYLFAILSMVHGARVVLYDGSPFLPDASTLVRLVDMYKVTRLGVSPKWMQTLVAAGMAPRKVANVSTLKSVNSTGMVLPESLFHWFYDVAFEPHTQLANITGGTDLAACIGMENPLTPLYVGGCQGPALGIAAAVYDSAQSAGDGTVIQGKEVPLGATGDLVVTKSFPNVPAMFWPGDDGAMKKYWESYFGKFDNVWAQGDYVQIHAQTKQIVMLGRADGVLNPGGVRFGSAELYNVIEARFPETIADSIVVGQRRPQDTDESVMLFLKMQPGVMFTPNVVADVKNAIAESCSKRHVPRYVFETPEIPTTVNLKKVELPVKHIVSGKDIEVSGTLANPQSLEYFRQFARDEVLQGRTSKI